MKADPIFSNKTPSFWACIKLLSQKTGYSKKGLPVKPNFQQIVLAFNKLDLDTKVLEISGKPTPLAHEILEYFSARADMLSNHVEPNLMTLDEAKKLYYKTRDELLPTRDAPVNRQKLAQGEPFYFTGLINMIIESNIKGMDCDYNPQALTTFTNNRSPLRTLSRRVDGAFPRHVDPIAFWEIKEYYYTTSFGSRVADGVYETLLDAIELNEMKQNTSKSSRHYLFIDAKDTWWGKGKSYLCRMVDMLHMGYVDEILFGREIFERLPSLVADWVSEAQAMELQKQ